MMATHDMGVASQADRVIALVDGQIASDIDPRSTPQLAALNMLKKKGATGQLAGVEK